ncbi:hypothetical protein PVA45_08400 (plasmid) [Entomospira entomophila]|uniref:Uncharacterized protein n=1 Tax=Entomospira entomophila TaxID=2719988 RepID=A0A968KUI8_9SPIO|nr:hypothetical protein [Entomospira entomophilus]NIZ41521.1 hypothetical protein [Entomospira entomophilus]WDI36395.1 hypothetical protein PVA45_08400 [Entomospira entomophilus]
MELITGKELAIALGVSASQITRARQAGYINYVDGQNKYHLEEATIGWQYSQSVKHGELINLTKTAEILQTTKSNITQMSQAGRLKAVQIGNKELFFSLKDVEVIRQSRQRENKEHEASDKDEKELKKQSLELDIAIKKITLLERQGRVMPIETVQQQNSMLIHKIDEYMAIGAERIAQAIRHCQSDDDRRVKIDYELHRFVKDLKRFMSEREVV